MIESITCLYFGKIFDAHISSVRKYCSKGCFALAKSKSFIIKKCPACREQYRTYVKTQTYCSRRCTGIATVKKRKKAGIYKRQGRGRNRVQIGDRRIDFHRYVFEQELGRRLTTSETVHHIDCNCTNDDRNNLYLYPNHSEHRRGHASIELLIPALLKQKNIYYEKGKYFIATLKRKNPQE